jgi:hypothetical protein
MNHFQPILADAAEWIRIIVILVFVLFSALGPLLTKLREAQREAARRARVGPPKPAPPKPKDPLADEITEFLKRAAQRQKPPAVRPAMVRPAGPPPVPLPVAPAPRPLRSPLRSPPLAPPLRPIEAEVVGAGPKRESVAEHVRESFGQSKFGHVISNDLGEDVAEEDDKIELRLRSVFDHRIGRLASMGGETSERAAPVPPDGLGTPAPTRAAGFAAILAQPTTLRQAIVASEILRRPEDRWG